VRKGEHGEPVVFVSKITRTEAAETGDETERQIPFLKGYVVFNVAQIDGLPPHFTAPAAPASDPVQRITHAESFFANTKIDIKHGGDRAYYVPSRDFVQMPPFETFRDAESFYATLAHECCHATGHEKRLNRDFGRKRWGDEGYAAEELVAELGSAFLCADLALTLEPRADHASYIENWLRVLKNDKRAIFTAAAHAERAAAFLHGLQPQTETAGEPAATESFDDETTRAAA
jgi:antirestriction protein ArdC